MSCPNTHKYCHVMSQHSRELSCHVPTLTRTVMSCPNTHENCHVTDSQLGYHFCVTALTYTAISEHSQGTIKSRHSRELTTSRHSGELSSHDTHGNCHVTTLTNTIISQASPHHVFFWSANSHRNEPKYFFMPGARAKWAGHGAEHADYVQSGRGTGRSMLTHVQSGWGMGRSYV